MSRLKVCRACRFNPPMEGEALCPVCDEFHEDGLISLYGYKGRCCYVRVSIRHLLPGSDQEPHRSRHGDHLLGKPGPQLGRGTEGGFIVPPAMREVIKAAVQAARQERERGAA